MPDWALRAKGELCLDGAHSKHIGPSASLQFPAIEARALMACEVCQHWRAITAARTPLEGKRKILLLGVSSSRD